VFPTAALSLPRAINKGRIAQAVSPVQEVTLLFDNIIGPIQWILVALAGLIVVVAGIGIMVSIYNSMADRRRDIAIMRALGASRTTVMVVILLESILLAVGGGLGGFVLGHGLIAAASPIIEGATGVTIGLRFVPLELILIPGLVILASLVGFLPAAAAYRTDVAKALSASP
jgi:putative ABC transport system permease protein